MKHATIRALTFHKQTNRAADVVDEVIKSLDLPAVTYGSPKQISWAISIVGEALRSIIADFPIGVGISEYRVDLDPDFAAMLPYIRDMMNRGAKEIIDNRDQFKRLSSKKFITVKLVKQGKG